MRPLHLSHGSAAPAAACAHVTEQPASGTREHPGALEIPRTFPTSMGAQYGALTLILSKGLKYRRLFEKLL